MLNKVREGKICSKLEDEGVSLGKKIKDRKEVVIGPEVRIFLVS